MSIKKSSGTVESETLQNGDGEEEEAAAKPTLSVPTAQVCAELG